MSIQPTRKPDVVGDYARIWHLKRSREQARAFPAHVRTALIHAPKSHTTFHWRVFTLVCLDDMEGVAPSMRHFPEARHEFMVITADPTGEPITSVDTAVFRYLVPPDVIFQSAANKTISIDAFEMAVNKVAIGSLVPDSDFRTHWEQTMEDWIGKQVARLH